VTPRAVPQVFYCIEKRRLMQEFLDAVKESLRLQSLQVEAVLNGDEFPREELAVANERVENSKYAIISHFEAHGCA
jgi:hypothetical protein